MKISRFGIAAAALGAMVSNAAPAQQAANAPAEEQDIVVTGRDLDKDISDFVGALTPSQVSGTLSRFEFEVCPGVAGVGPEQKAAVVKRMRVIAKAAGLKVAGGTCAPNVQLIVASDKKVLLKGLLQRYPAYFTGLEPSAMRKIMKEPGSAAAWHIRGDPLDGDGMVITENSGGALINRTTRTASRITPVGRVPFAAAVVVVESKALEGLTTTQLADYAAMRAFARIDTEKATTTNAPTILKVLDAPDDAEVPITMTEWDLAFLRALYDSDPNAYAATQRSEIKKRLGKELEEEQGGGKQ
jgi:hypothetical protein